MSKCKTRQELAAEYGISRNTFTRLLKRNQIHLDKGLLTPDAVRRVYALLGKPSPASLHRFEPRGDSN